MDSQDLKIRFVLVPAGAEHWAVKRGLSRVKDAPQLVAIPAGPQGVSRFLDRFLEVWKEGSLLQGSNVLLMGLAGGLSSEHRVGDAMVLRRVWHDCTGEGEGDGDEVVECDFELTGQVAKRLRCEMGIGVTCDRVITTVKEKQGLGDRYSADVVDMESATLLKVFSESTKLGLPKVVILRVISDACDHDLPDISRAVAPDGALNTRMLFRQFVARPGAAIRFIKNALIGLSRLSKQASVLFE